MTEIISLRLLKLHMHNEILFSLTNPRLKIRQDKLITILHNFTMNVIEERRKIVKEKLQTNDINTEIDEDIGVKKRMAFLDVLLQSTAEGKALTNDDIREEVDTFMFEGHDTTTSAICFALYLIARHSQVQQKLYKEIVEVLGKNIDKPINLHDLNNLNYMECVIKESLRLYPSVAIIGREILEDFEYSKFLKYHKFSFF